MIECMGKLMHDKQAELNNIVHVHGMVMAMVVYVRTW